MRSSKTFLLLGTLLLAAAPAHGKAKPVVVQGQSCEQNMECSWPALNVSRKARVTASSVLENKKDYAAANVLDASPDADADYFAGNHATAWCEGKKDTGKGESIRIAFDKPVEVSALLVSAGYDKNMDIFSKNSRLKKAKLELSDGSVYELRFGEHFIDMNNGKSSFQPLKTQSAIANSPQMFLLAPGNSAPKKVAWMKLTITETVPGWKYNDTCISTIDIIPHKDTE